MESEPEKTEERKTMSHDVPTPEEEHQAGLHDSFKRVECRLCAEEDYAEERRELLSLIEQERDLFENLAKKWIEESWGTRKEEMERDLRKTYLDIVSLYGRED